MATPEKRKIFTIVERALETLKCLLTMHYAHDRHDTRQAKITLQGRGCTVFL